MKDIKEFLVNESLFDVFLSNGRFKVENIIVGKSGSMSKDGPEVLKVLKKTFKGAKFFTLGEDGVTPLNDVKDFDAVGPHVDFGQLQKFYRDHVGEMTLFFQN